MNNNHIAKNDDIIVKECYAGVIPLLKQGGEETLISICFKPGLAFLVRFNNKNPRSLVNTGRRLIKVLKISH